MAKALLAAKPPQRRAETAGPSPAGARHDALERRPSARSEDGLRSLLETRAQVGPAPVQRVQMKGITIDNSVPGVASLHGGGSGTSVIQRRPTQRDAATGAWRDDVYPHLELTQRQIGQDKYRFETADGSIVYWQDGVYYTDPEREHEYAVPAAPPAAGSFHYTPIPRPDMKLLSLADVRSRLDSESLAKLREPDRQKLQTQVEELEAGGGVAPIALRLENERYSLQDGRHRILASERQGYTHIPAVVEGERVAGAAAAASSSSFRPSTAGSAAASDAATAASAAGSSASAAGAASGSGWAIAGARPWPGPVRPNGDPVGPLDARAMIIAWAAKGISAPVIAAELQLPVEHVELVIRQSRQR